MDKADMLGLLNAAIRRHGSQAAFARHAGVSDVHISQVANAIREPGPAVLSALGLRKVVTYQRTNGGPDGR